MKNLSAWIAAYLILIANPLSSETFTNTNDDENGKSFGQLMSWVFDGEKSPDKIEIETSDQWQTLTDEDESYAVWIGHATYLINNGDINILTDPIFSKRASPIRFAGPKRMIPPVMSIDDLPKIDVVVVSHNHYDHLDMYSLKKLHKINPETIFLVPMGDKKRLIKAGLTQVHEMRWWESIKAGRSTIHFTPVQHWSKRGLFDRNKSLWGGWFFESSDLKLYHAGDTGYSNDFKTTYQRLGAPEYSFIPIGAYDPRWFMKDSHVNPEEAVQIALDLKTPHSFGMHWGTFTLTDEPIAEPPQRLAAELKAKGLSPDFFRSPKPGEVLSLSK
ncbi:MBL fold metallo-hydrolase [Gammaproteobacteria bacterium]|nr:MBL fold metallo-hydrolase [Gammaproteobacteria bacterium]MDB9860200.1 MBL fold metallo-hydrolase [Gammaproteobacteria bacterium]MDB9940199.1 MBL fold metallo-hydrolase [Gammaproteobacteria bacterium]